MSVALGCWDETRGPKATCSRESLFEFTVPEQESIRAGRYSSRHDGGWELGAHGLECRHTEESRREPDGDCKLKASHQGHASSGEATLLSLPKECHQLGTKYLNMGTFLIKATMVNILVSYCANS